MHNNEIYRFLITESPLTRLLDSHYKDGTYAPSGDDRPNPRTISNYTMSGLTGEGSYMGRTALLVFFGALLILIWLNIMQLFTNFLVCSVSGNVIEELKCILIILDCSLKTFCSIFFKCKFQ